MRASSLPPGRDTRKRSDSLPEKPPLTSCEPDNVFSTGSLLLQSTGTRKTTRRSRLPSGGAGHPLSDHVCDSPSVTGLAEEGTTPSVGTAGKDGSVRLEDLGWKSVKEPLSKTASGPLPCSVAAYVPSPDDLVIHVIDEVRGVRRDFTCRRTMLLNHMKYFEAYLAGLNYDDEVDISVHCDIDVFEWLVEYMEDSKKVEMLDASTVVSILISSNFLQMAKLVDECLTYINRSINQVVRLPIDLGCLSDDLVKRLACLFTDEELHNVRDKRDRIQNRLFAHKVEELLGDDENTLFLCIYCHSLFTSKQREFVVCPKAAIFIDFHGNVIAKHVASTNWDASHYVQHCHEHLQFSWQQIYWRVWSQMQLLYCSRCHRHFCGAEYEHCSYHPEKPVWHGTRGHVGSYLCCKQPAFKFGAPSLQMGCCAREHAVDMREGRHKIDPDLMCQATVLEKLIRHKTETCVPFADRFTDRFSGEVQSSTYLGEMDEEEEDEARTDADWKEEQKDVYSESIHRWNDGTGAYKGRVCYCLDPPPEHCHPEQQHVFKHPRAGRRHRPKRILSASRQRGPSAARQTNNSNTVAEDLNQSMSSMQSGRWPTPLPEGSPSFFNFSLPSSMSAQRKLEYRMDMLREDDRRRMDMLAGRIHHQVEKRNNQVIVERTGTIQKGLSSGQLAQQHTRPSAQRRHRDQV